MQYAVRVLGLKPTRDGDKRQTQQSAMKHTEMKKIVSECIPTTRVSFDSLMGPAKFRGRQICAFVICYIAYATMYCSRKPFSVVKTLVQSDLNLSTVVLSNIDTAFLASYAVGQLVLPMVAESMGARTSLFICFLGSAFTLVVFSLADDAKVLVFVWLVNGLMNSPTFPVIVKMVSPWFTGAQRGSAMGLWVTSQQLGSFVATAFSAWISKRVDWRAAFLCPALLVFLVGVSVFLFLPDPPPPGFLQPNSKTSPYGVLGDEEEGGHLKSSPVAAVGGETVGLASEGDCGERRGSAFGEREGEAARLVGISKLSPQGETAARGRDREREGSQAIPTPPLYAQKGGSDRVGGGAKLGQSTSAGTGEASGSPGVEARDRDRGLVSGETAAGAGAGGGTGAGGAEMASDGREREKGGGEPAAVPSLWSVLRVPHLLNAMAAYFCVKLIRYSLLMWLPFFLIKQLSYSPEVAGYSSLFFDFGGIFGAVSAGFFADRFLGGKRLVCVLVLTLATGFSILIFSWASHVHVAAMMGAMCLVGFAIAGPDALLGAAAAQDLTERAGVTGSALSMAAGLVNGVGSTGAVVQGYVTAFVSDVYGWDALFGILCGTAVLSTILLVPPALAIQLDSIRGGNAGGRRVGSVAPNPGAGRSENKVHV
uniref:Major facilitator superfamily (MFS) profile domain-containing protein n=1 Tax=Chromera velia CCMP2878 TaxID=1169474 RepID=A0A0G4HY31_9ALVE|eukprot:Cvel_9396.t1-p1 / transcript=Cvel_9396.t1 / gene=Cvel_9396 / organism=Chromera_velia_CCMP2878 / gene_product=Putative glycerol-3-phosphate transporter 1, putative / transcript_product=Putative glycerol-3-phosphate transporter 1, putative / location=Cvel_scaffold540:4115-8292(+) / protein_length=651 / sequence_SO=supercontig / SO=protein_coding / is_pseudo=false